MKKTFKILLVIILGLLLLSGITASIFFNKPKTPVFAFYNLSEKQEKAFTSVLDASIQGEYKLVKLEDGIPLSKQTDKLKKVSAVFALSDADVRDFALNSTMVTSVPKALTTEMPLSITGTLQQKADGYSYLPILYDMYEIDVNFDLFTQTTIKNINKWNDLLNLATEELKFTSTPVSFTGSDNVEFLNLFGQLFEVFQTYQKYEDLYNQLYEAFKKDLAEDFKTTNCEKLINDLLETNPDLKNCITRINRMISAKQINQNTLKQTEADTLFLCNNGFAGITFLKLTDHRKINRDIIGHYRSIFFPSFFNDDSRKFAASEYSILLLKNNDLTRKLLTDFSDTKQYELCAQTGLSPVQRNCQTPDRQADDVRYWLAASLGPLPPLATAIPEKKMQQVIADILRRQIGNLE